MQREAERIAKGIYNGTITSGEIDPTLTQLVSEKLRDAVINGFGEDLPAIDYNTPDYEKLADLEKSVYQFSAAKDYQQLKSMTLALKDGDRIRTFAEFRNEALKISDVYVGAWLKTEYNTAVTAAQMASKWVYFQANKKELPYLVFSAIIDGHTTELCLSLNELTALVDDPIWDIVFPPNHYGERSTVLNSAEGPATPQEDIVIPDIPKMFRVNVAKEGLAFPPGHPYYTGVPPEILQKAADLLGQRILNWAKKNIGGKEITAPEIGKVEINIKGLKKIIHQGHEFKTEKNQAVYVLDKIIHNAQFIKSVPDQKGRNLLFHYFKFKLKGKDSYLVIKESMDGKKVAYSIVDKIK